MQILRIFQPYGAHLRFDDATNLQVSPAGLLRFNFKPKDENGQSKDEVAMAIFNLGVISGYSLEGPEEKIIHPSKEIVVP